MNTEYHLLDIPTSLTPNSFLNLKPKSSIPPSQPRNPPEPKHNTTPWPQSTDLKKLHEQHGKSVDEAIQAAHADGITEWCKPRLEHEEESHDEGIRKWDEMFRIMDSFRGEQVWPMFQLSDNGLSRQKH